MKTIRTAVIAAALASLIGAGFVLAQTGFFPTPNQFRIGPAGTATPMSLVRVYSQSLTPAEVATIVCAEQTFTVTGLTTADKVFVNPPADTKALSVTAARVSAANTLALRYCNPTAGNLTPDAGTYTIFAIRTP